MTKSAIAKNTSPSISPSLPSGQVAFFRSLFEGSSDTVQLDDTEGQVIFSNGAWLSLFQVDAADAVGVKWAKLVKGRLCKGEQLGRSWSRSKKGSPSQGTVALKADGDARMQVSYTRMPVRGKNDEVLAVVSIFRQEMLEPSDAGIGETVHDIKNAFTAIVIGAQLLERQNQDAPDLISKTDLIQKASARGLELLQNLRGDA